MIDDEYSSEEVLQLWGGVFESLFSGDHIPQVKPIRALLLNISQDVEPFERVLRE